MLVLEFGEAIPAVRRFQDRRKYIAPGQQSGHGLDGHVLLARVADHQRGQTNDHDVYPVLGGAHVQRTARCRVPCQPEQQFLLRAVAHHVVPLRTAGRLRHRLD